MSETTQTAMYYNGNWYGRSGNTDALDARITQTANNIAPRQISDTASKLIAVGEYFTDKLGRLCVCDVQIASGGSIVVGSNCHVVSEGIGNELGSNMPSGNLSYTGSSWADINTTHNLGLNSDFISNVLTILNDGAKTGIQTVSYNGTPVNCLVLRFTNWGQASIMVSGATVDKNDCSLIVFSKGVSATSWRISIMP